MPSKQEGNPNLNAGGNEGNVFGAGAKRKALRLRKLNALGLSEKDLSKILKWQPVFPVLDEAGKLKRLRPPNVDEWKWAMEYQAKYGLGPISSLELTGEDGAPLPATAPSLVMVDLSKLSYEELDLLEKIHERNAAEPGEHPQGQG